MRRSRLRRYAPPYANLALLGMPNLLAAHSVLFSLLPFYVRLQLLLDYELEDMVAMEVLQALNVPEREDLSKMRIIIVSGNDSIGDVDALKALGMHAYWVKPVTDALLNSLEDEIRADAAVVAEAGESAAQPAAAAAASGDATPSEAPAP